MVKKDITKALKLAKKGDQESFALLYSNFARSIYYLACRITKDENYANDIVQEVMIKLYQNLSNIQKLDSINSFVRKTTYNCSIDMLRKNNPHIDLSSEEDVLNNIPEFNKDFIPEECLESEEKKKRIVDLVNNLSDAQRTTVLLYYFEDLPVNEIASIMNVNIDVVNSRLYRARNNLKKSLELKEIFAVGATITTLSKILDLDAAALFTEEISIANWSILAKSLNFPAEIVSRTLKVASKGVLSTKTAGATMGVLGVKTFSAVVAFTVVAGSVGYGINYYVNNDSKPIESIIIKSEGLNEIQNHTQEEVDSLSTPMPNYSANSYTEDTVEEKINTDISELPPISSTVDSSEFEEMNISVLNEDFDLNLITAENPILYYKQGQKVSEKEILSAARIFVFPGCKIATYSYDDIDFDTPNDYLMNIVVTNSSNKVIKPLVVIIIVESNTEESNEQIVKEN